MQHSARIRSARREDAAALVRIYNHYVLHTTITFDEEPLDEQGMLDHMLLEDSRHPWLVIQQGDRVRGYAGAVPWKSRCAYRHSVESSVYLDPEALGRGLGKRLYGALVKRVAQGGMHSMIGGIALPNPASIALHESLGFRPAGRFREVGRKFDRWIDVGYWELVFPEAEESDEGGAD